MKKITPLADNVLVKLDKPVQETGSGLLLGAAVAEFGGHLLSGVVVAAGPGGYGYSGPSLVADESKRGKRKFFPVDVVAGDRVLFKKLAGDVVDLELGTATAPQHQTDREYRMLRSSQIEATLALDD